MKYFHGLERRLRGKDRAWWNYFDVQFDDSHFRVVDRRIFGSDRIASVLWQDVRAVCFVDGGLGSDVFRIYTDPDQQEPSAQVPTECDGGQMFWQELKRRELFPESASGAAVTSTAGGSELWWPPRR
jgi:hypothetical protein